MHSLHRWADGLGRKACDCSPPGSRICGRTSLSAESSESRVAPAHLDNDLKGRRTFAAGVSVNVLRVSARLPVAGIQQHIPELDVHVGRWGRVSPAGGSVRSAWTAALGRFSLHFGLPQGYSLGFFNSCSLIQRRYGLLLSLVWC